MHYPKAVPQEEWPAAHRKLLGLDKELTGQRDALTAQRRKLPMVQAQWARAVLCLSSVVISRTPRLRTAR